MNPARLDLSPLVLRPFLRALMHRVSALRIARPVHYCILIFQFISSGVRVGVAVFIGEYRDQVPHEVAAASAGVNRGLAK